MALFKGNKYTFRRKWEKTAVVNEQTSGQSSKGKEHEGERKVTQETLAGKQDEMAREKTATSLTKPPASMKAMAPPKPPAPAKAPTPKALAPSKAPAPTKTPAAKNDINMATKAPAAPKCAPVGKKAKAPAAGPSKTPAAGSSKANKVKRPSNPDDAMNIDPVETGGDKTQGPPAKKAKAGNPSDKQRQEHAEASYDPEAKEDGHEYDDKGETGSKRKRESSKGTSKPRKTKAPKSVEIVESGDEALVKASTAAKKVGGSSLTKKGPKSPEFVDSSDNDKTLAKLSAVASAPPAGIAKKPTKPATKKSDPKRSDQKEKEKEKEKEKKGKGKEKQPRPRSNFRKYLNPDDLAEYNRILARMSLRDLLTPEEKYSHAVWLKSVIKADPSMAPRFKLRDNSCKAIVLMEQTLVPPEHTQYNESPCDYCCDFAPFRCFVLDQGTSCIICNLFRHSKCMKNGLPVMWRKGDPEVLIVKKRMGAPFAGAPFADLDTEVDVSLAEVQQTQTHQTTAIQALQSQMDAMSLGMAACGSVLKNAKERVEEHCTATSEIGRMVEGRVSTLNNLLQKLKDGQQNLSQPSPTIPHHLMETHLNNISTLVKVGADFAAVFSSLAADAEQVTEVLAEWLQGEGTEEIDMNDVFEATDVEQSGEEDGQEDEDEEDELQSDDD